MNSVLSSASSSQAAQQRHAEQADADADDQRRLHEADDDVGDDLAQHDLDRRDRHGEQAFHGAALDLARDRERGEDQHGHGQDGADEPRHDVERGVGRRGCSGHGCGSRTAAWRCPGSRGRAGARSAPGCRAPPWRSPRRPDRSRRRRPAAPAGRRAGPSRSKLAGISIANRTLPEASRRSNSASLSTTWVTSKYAVFCDAP